MKAALKKAAKTVALQDLVAASKLIAIDLVDFIIHREHAAATALLLALPETVDMDIRVRSRHRHHIEGDGTSFLADLDATWVGKEKREAFGFAKMTLRLAYAFSPAPGDVPIDVIAAFGTQVAMHHAWPFLRERLDAAARMLGMPTPILPLNHLAPSLKAEIKPDQGR